jgi:K+-transporting ATPase ATPase A chain
MTANSWLQFAVFIVVLVGLAVPLGSYMARVFEGRATLVGRWLGPLERAVYRASGVSPDDEMTWKRYAVALLIFNAAGAIFLYFLQRFQASLPLNPAGLADVPSGVALNTAVSFATNTNWQAYGGETTLSHLTQMLGLTTQNFVSAATGIAVLLAACRGFSRGGVNTLGNFWVDLVRSTLFVLLPLSVVLAIALVATGVVQTLDASVVAQWVDPTVATVSGAAEQVIALGPAASQVAIKQLGTNGGGFFNVNSAHPLENPTAISNFLQLVSILLIPAALCFTGGALLRNRPHGRALFAAMLVIFVPLCLLTVSFEQAGNPALTSLGVEQASGPDFPGGNLEGKEARFGITQSALWAVATTAASNGSVNAMHDSFTPLGGLIPMALMQLGEVVFGGVGSGLYGMMLYAILAVFIAGLMVGRTPEYLGKKVEAFEVKMASLAILLPSAMVLVGTAIACVTEDGRSAIANPGPHGFSEILYAFSSGANNNGSAFGGLTVSGDFYTAAIAACMWLGRFGVIVPVLAMAASFGRKQLVPPSAGTLPTHGPLFVALLVAVVLLLGALTFVPALALGPVVEQLMLTGEV